MWIYLQMDFHLRKINIKPLTTLGTSTKKCFEFAVIDSMILFVTGDGYSNRNSNQQLYESSINGLNTMTIIF